MRSHLYVQSQLLITNGTAVVAQTLPTIMPRREGLAHPGGQLRGILESHLALQDWLSAGRTKGW